MVESGYPDARAVEAAIKAAAKNAHDADPTRHTGDLIRQAHYDRFLCRIFSEADAAQWVLKGGTGMLARVRDARRTLDADLSRAGVGKDQALADLRRLAELDLGDHFRFVYREHHEILTDDAQPYTDGYRVTFDAYLGVRLIETIKVDLSVGVFPADGLEVVEPANRLGLPRLVTRPYRLYPVANQIADKVCATISDYGGRPSTREKDLVDLVIIAATQSVDALVLRQAIRSECTRRRLRFPEEFGVPAYWGAAYARLAKNTPAEPYPITAARGLLSEFIDPILTGEVVGAWHPETRVWS